MSQKTEIAYCDSTVNSVVGCLGCELHSAACPDKSTCYAAALTARWAGKPGWPASFDQPQHFPDRLPRAVRWADLRGKKRPEKPWLDGYPRVIFVNDLSDGFHSIDPEVWLTPHLEAMVASPHIWLLCTKRPDVMAEYFERHPAPSNFWLMTTVTSQATVWRALELSRIHGASLLLSLEPLLGEVDLMYPKAAFPDGPQMCCSGQDCGCRGMPVDPPLLWYFQGVFVGGASGPRAKPMHPGWARKIRDDCAAVGVPFLFKQWGEWEPILAAADGWSAYADDPVLLRSAARECIVLWPDGRTAKPEPNLDWWGQDFDGDDDGDPVELSGCALVMRRAGKRVTGRLLDGREHMAMPEVRRA